MGMNEEALSVFAEAAQDMASAGLELALGRHFACADICNQVVEKSFQAVSMLREGHRVMYDHDLCALGEAVGAPPAILEDAAALSPYHPETYYAETPPEDADQTISAEEAQFLMQRARRVLRWARGIIIESP
jgi:HEPN domain-containing protein